MGMAQHLPHGPVVRIKGNGTCHVPGECLAPLKDWEMLAVFLSCAVLAPDPAEVWLLGQGDMGTADT